MFKNVVFSCSLVFLFISILNTTEAFAQKWIPKGLRNTTVLVEQFKYQDPGNTLLDVDEFYEDEKDDFIEVTNESLEAYNEKMKEHFAAYTGPFELAVPNKIDEDYTDLAKYRYVLKREAFFGKKKVYDLASKETSDKSYFAYRYFFYDRETKKEFTPYYFSGEQWKQIDRLIFWLNQAE